MIEREIYNGLDRIGSIETGRRKPFRALAADGRSRGEFDSEGEAMAAIIGRSTGKPALRGDDDNSRGADGGGL
jgi:hypothetical protein